MSSSGGVKGQIMANGSGIREEDKEEIGDRGRVEAATRRRPPPEADEGASDT